MALQVQFRNSTSFNKDRRVQEMASKSHDYKLRNIDQVLLEVDQVQQWWKHHCCPFCLDAVALTGSCVFAKVTKLSSPPITSTKIFHELDMNYYRRKRRTSLFLSPSFDTEPTEVVVPLHLPPPPYLPPNVRIECHSCSVFINSSINDHAAAET